METVWCNTCSDNIRLDSLPDPDEFDLGQAVLHLDAAHYGVGNVGTGGEGMGALNGVIEFEVECPKCGSALDDVNARVDATVMVSSYNIQDVDEVVFCGYTTDGVGLDSAAQSNDRSDFQAEMGEWLEFAADAEAQAELQESLTDLVRQLDDNGEDASGAVTTIDALTEAQIALNNIDSDAWGPIRRAVIEAYESELERKRASVLKKWGLQRFGAFTTRPGITCEPDKVVVTLLTNCTATVDIAMYSLKKPGAFRFLIHKATSARRPLKIRLLLDLGQNSKWVKEIFQNNPEWGRLSIRLLAGIGTFGSMHHKLWIFDREVVASGSHNVSYTASRNSFENLTVSHDIDTVSPLVQEFDEMWNKGRTPEQLWSTPPAKKAKASNDIAKDGKLDQVSSSSKPKSSQAKGRSDGQ